MDVAFVVELIVFIILLGFSGFFSSTETSLFSLNKLQLEKMRVDGNRRIDLIERLLSEPRRLIVTILIGNEFVNVAASVISAAMVIQLFGAENKFVNLFVMVPILLVFGEITPKVLAIRNNVAFATFESGPIDQFARLITPVRWVVRIVSEWFTTLIVGKERSKGNIVTEDMVRTLAREAVGEGTLDHAEAQYIDQIFDFGSQRVNDLMTARADVTFVPIEATGAEILAIFRESRQSRMPVYEENRDNILGILHARDLLAVDLNELGPDRETLETLLRPPYFVPESKPASELFDTFRHRKKSFALVVDEYGGVTGVITMGDLLGAIFGDIPTPSDEADDDWFHELADNRFALPGATSLEDFNSRFHANFAVDDVRTLGGLVLHHFGELPEESASIEIWPFRFTAQRIEANRITEILVELLPGAKPDPLEHREARTPNEEPPTLSQPRPDA
ncbi:MAG: HlyC/CorC family transporter [Gammaproteobacteria bacterium]|nr:HlyC/CorC family transporter [Gammaproteobacteria bacterium]